MVQRELDKLDIGLSYSLPSYGPFCYGLNPERWYGQKTNNKKTYRKNLKRFISENVDKTAVIMTDNFKAYRIIRRIITTNL